MPHILCLGVLVGRLLLSLDRCRLCLGIVEDGVDWERGAVGWCVPGKRLGQVCGRSADAHGRMQRVHRLGIRRDLGRVHTDRHHPGTHEALNRNAVASTHGTCSADYVGLTWSLLAEPLCAPAPGLDLGLALPAGTR